MVLLDGGLVSDLSKLYLSLFPGTLMVILLASCNCIHFLHIFIVECRIKLQAVLHVKLFHESLKVNVLSCS